ncbi:MAG: NTP transferase domain-containing protein [Candidatus Thorarchaeota archaeon]|nr:NTP transferase domain-containing protein [Candidatus Thorarchaeota archaeon]
MRKAAILAAGDSTRMLPLSANMPKHLLPVGGSPLIFHTLRALRDAGIRETLILYGYRGEEIRREIDAVDWAPMEIVYEEQKERKGTAHAAGHVRGFAGDDEVLLMYGDVLVGPKTFPGIIDAHKRGAFSMTLTVKEVDDPTAYGIVVVEDGKATQIIEKPRQEQLVSKLANTGIYIAGTELWDAIARTPLSQRGEYEITDSISMLIKEGHVGAYALPSWWIDVGKPWDLLRANELILEAVDRRIEGEVEEGAVLKGKVVVEQKATVRSGSYVEGPVYISEESVVGPNCYIRPHTLLCRKTKVGNAVEVKNSIIMEGTSIGHLSYVGDSVIGRRVNFGAGTITANLRHDDRPISVTIKDQRVSSGRRKLGAIIGDSVKTGIGTSIGPGVIIHQGARTGIGVIVDRDIGPNKLVIANQPKTTIDIGPET